MMGCIRLGLASFLIPTIFIDFLFGNGFCFLPLFRTVYILFKKWCAQLACKAAILVNYLRRNFDLM